MGTVDPTVMQLLGISVTAFAVGLSGAVMPGPLLAVTIDESVRRGAKAGPLLMIGHALLEGVLVVALALGLTTFLANRAVVGTISVVGGLTLLCMGAAMLRASRRVSLEGDTATVTRKRLPPLLAGILVSLSNPYWTIWWITIGSGYVVMGMRYGVPGLVAFFVGHILSDFAWYTLVSVGVASGRSLFKPAMFRRLVAVCGVVLLVFGAWFLWVGLATATGRSTLITPTT